MTDTTVVESSNMEWAIKKKPCKKNKRRRKVEKTYKRDMINKDRKDYERNIVNVFESIGIAVRPATACVIIAEYLSLTQQYLWFDHRSRVLDGADLVDDHGLIEAAFKVDPDKVCTEDHLYACAEHAHADMIVPLFRAVAKPLHIGELYIGMITRSIKSGDLRTAYNVLELAFVNPDPVIMNDDLLTEIFNARIGHEKYQLSVQYKIRMHHVTAMMYGLASSVMDSGDVKMLKLVYGLKDIFSSNKFKFIDLNKFTYDYFACQTCRVTYQGGYTYPPCGHKLRKNPLFDLPSRDFDKYTLMMRDIIERSERIESAKKDDDKKVKEPNNGVNILNRYLGSAFERCIEKMSVELVIHTSDSSRAKKDSSSLRDTSQGDDGNRPLPSKTFGIVHPEPVKKMRLDVDGANADKMLFLQEVTGVLIRNGFRFSTYGLSDVWSGEGAVDKYKFLKRYLVLNYLGRTDELYQRDIKLLEYGPMGFKLE